MECPNLAGCPFFNEILKNMPSTDNILKKEYCKKNYKECARYIVASAIGKENVPIDLYPNDKNRAERIIEKHNG